VKFPKTTEADIDRQPDLDDLEGYLWRREGARLARLASQVPDGECIVEIGSNRGKSACFLARGSKAGNRAKVHCVDLWTLGGQGEYQHLGFDAAETLETFRRQVADKQMKSMIVEHQGDSVELGQEWSGQPIGLLFVDGDHRYEAVKADVEAWSPHLAPGAVVAFHDYTETFGSEVTHFEGVERYVPEFVASVRPAEVTRTGRLVAVKLS
jgi:predicted O-methyltransferase YrrM